jgi:anti-anti-sigma factor
VPSILHDESSSLGHGVDPPDTIRIDFWDFTVMKFEVEDLGSYHIVRFSGVLDGAIRQLSSDSVHPIIEDKDARVLVDLSGVERLTSEAIAVFVAMVSRANSKGSRVVFVNPSPFVHAIFEITRITKFLETYDSTEKGLDRLLVSE